MIVLPVSIGDRLCRRLLWQTVLGLGVLCAGIYTATAMRFHAERQDQLAARVAVARELARTAGLDGGAAALARTFAEHAPRRPGTFLEVWRADGSLLYQDAAEALPPPSHACRVDFDAALRAEPLKGRFSLDCSRDDRMLGGLALTLLAATLAGAAFVGFGTTSQVRRALQPLADLARQTQAIAPDRLGERLSLPEPIAELQPWIDQFNDLMARLQRAYVQLEGFNADVAHELRTPVASLMGHTEVALSRERSPEALRETLHSNLEELQRLAALVNDMLFLSQADRGAVARRGQPVSLAALARQVVEFHEAPLADAGLAVQIEGDTFAAVDEPLFKRAVSNLLGNAIRFAEPGSRVRVRITPDESEQVRVEVQNAGPAIAPQHLTRLFDRFFRIDSARPDSQSHHGLGLAIVAAIARMHAGRPVAASEGGSTRIGFTFVAQ